MIDFEGQVVIVTGAGRGLGRLYALEVARRGGAVVANDLGSTMHGQGSDASVAEQVALEIERAGGVAVASHDSVARPANVIAIEGAAHGILANSVLPFGLSRMVTETIGGAQVAEQSAFLRAIEPELVVPLVAFLASRACEFTHHCYSACAGRYARVFIGLGQGWLAEPGSRPTVDDVAAHLAEVSATEPFSVPASIFDEVSGVCARLGIAG
jgi:NAD(P)-dependent dehydrogenase (short-subunit alcohol dehydrogenase family)